LNPKVLLVAAALIAGACQQKPAAFRGAAELINKTIRDNHYRPIELNGDVYTKIEKDVIALGDTAASADEFVKGFREIWKKGPFSHVSLGRAEEPVADRMARIDTASAGDSAVMLDWKGSTAILTVNNMTGTIKAIDAAYGEITAGSATKLIIDLRRNQGGAFAVVPLIGHLISEPIDAGVFVSGLWFASHAAPPGPADFASATPWRGYSVRDFQVDVLTRPLTSYRIDPMLPRFGGPVFVLTSARTISAGEIVADALKAIGRATIIGEKTPGIVLSSKLFDIPGGFHLRVPIADYYSIKNGHLESVGVVPDRPIDAAKALDAALGQPGGPASRGR
jgi:hypothetical protein